MPSLDDLGHFGDTVKAMFVRAVNSVLDMDDAAFEAKCRELEEITDQIRRAVAALKTRPAPEVPASPVPPDSDASPTLPGGASESPTPEPPPDAAPAPPSDPAPEPVAPEPAPEPEPVPEPAPVAEDPAPRTRRGPK